MTRDRFEGRREYGRYFGICSSYHHTKGCICKNCPTYPEDDRLMYCARGKSTSPAEKKGCLCSECIIHDKFKLRGDYFCHGTG